MRMAPIVALLLLAVTAPGVTAAESTAPPQPVAVLEFRNLGPSVELEPLRKALAHMLAADLAQRGAVVVAREWAEPLVQEQELARAGITSAGNDRVSLRPARIVSGSFAANGDGIALDVQIREVNGASSLSLRTSKLGPVLFQKSFRAQPEDIFDLESRVLPFVVESLGMQEPNGATPPATSGSVTVAVMSVYNLSANGRLDAYQEPYADELSARLANSDKIAVVERGRIRELLKETALGLLATATADLPKVSRLLAADRIVVTAMLEAGGTVRLDGLVVEPNTGVVAAAVTRSGPASRPGDVVGELASGLAQAALRSVPNLPPPGEAVDGATLPRATQAPPPPLTGPDSRGPGASEPDAMANVPQEARMHLEQAQGLGRAGRWDLATEEYYRAIHVAPDWPWAWEGLGHAFAKSNRQEEAAEAYYAASRAFKAAGDERGARYALSMAVEFHMRAGQYRKALDLTPELLVIAPPQDRLGASMMRASALAFNGQFAGAVAVAEEFAKAGDTGSAFEVYEWLVPDRFVAESRPDPLSAEQRLAVARRVLELFPEKRGANALGGACLRATDPQDVGGSLAALRRAAERFRHNREFVAEVLVSSARFLEHAGHYKEAAQAYEEYIAEYARAEQDSEPYLRLAQIYTDNLNQPQRAIAIYQLVLAQVLPAGGLCQFCLDKLNALGGSPPPIRVPEQARPRVSVVAGDPFRASLLDSWGYQAQPRYWRGPLRFGDADIEWLRVTLGVRYAAADIERLRHHVFVGGQALIVLTDADLPRGNQIAYSPAWIVGCLGFGFADKPARPPARPSRWALASHPLAAHLGELNHPYGWWALNVPDEWVVARLNDTPVIAARRFGLGRVVVISLSRTDMAVTDPAIYKPSPEDAQWVTQVRRTIRAALDWLRDPGSSTDDTLAAGLLEAERKENAGDRSAAAAILQRSWREQPLSPYGQEAKFWLARMRWEAGDAGAATADLQELLRLAPALGATSTEALTNVGDFTDHGREVARMARLMLGEIAEQGEQWEQARQHYADAAGKVRDSIWLQAHLHQALCWLKQQDFAKAATEFRQVADNQADGDGRVRALFGGAYCYERLGRNEDAVRLYRYLGSAYRDAELDLRGATDPFERYLGAGLGSGESRGVNITWAVQRKLHALADAGGAAGG